MTWTGTGTRGRGTRLIRRITTRFRTGTAPPPPAWGAGGITMMTRTRRFRTGASGTNCAQAWTLTRTGTGGLTRRVPAARLRGMMMTPTITAGRGGRRLGGTPAPPRSSRPFLTATATPLTTCTSTWTPAAMMMASMWGCSASLALPATPGRRGMCGWWSLMCGMCGTAPPL